MSDNPKYKMPKFENITKIAGIPVEGVVHIEYGRPVTVKGKPQMDIAINGKDYTVISCEETEEPGIVQGKMIDSKGEVFTYQLKVWGEWGDSIMDEFRRLL